MTSVTTVDPGSVGLPLAAGFGRHYPTIWFDGCSPTRINPGDKEHTLTRPGGVITDVIKGLLDPAAVRAAGFSLWRL